MSKGGGGVNIPSDYTISIGSANPPLQVDATIDPLTVTSNSNLAVTQPIVTQASSNSTASLDLKIEPLDVKLEPIDLKIEPLTVDTDSTIDLKPVVLDSCQTIRLAPLPPIRIEQPYSQHFGFTYMGMELWGFTMSGRSEVLLNSPGKCHSGEPQFHHREGGERSAPPAPGSSGARPGGGLRVRVNDTP